MTGMFKRWKLQLLSVMVYINLSLYINKFISISESTSDQSSNGSSITKG